MGGGLGNNPLAFRAALSRILVVLLFLMLLPIAAPAMGKWLWVFGLYLLSAVIWQYLIWRDLGGQLRAIGGGLADITLITFMVQRMGSVSTVLISLYIFLGVVNALVVRRPVAIGLALTGALAYVAVLIAECNGWIPHAPDGDFGTAVQIDGRQAVAAGVIVSALMLGTTLVVSRLVRAHRRRELLLIAANEQLKQLSERDPLTQLYNRRHLLSRIDIELARVERGHPLSLLLVDLDKFKAVNDAHGHLQGDELLRRVAAALEHAIRASDVAGRFGGDEFVIVLPDTEAQQATVVADRLIADVRATAEQTNPRSPVTASVGLALARESDTASDLLRRADEATYQAKADGGNRLATEM